MRNLGVLGNSRGEIIGMRGMLATVWRRKS
jgi:hypothetical protein